MRMEEIQRSTREFENAEGQITYRDIKPRVPENAGICNNPDNPLPQQHFKLSPQINRPH